MFDFVEVSLDKVALAIDRVIYGALRLAIPLGWDMRFGPARPDLLDQRHRVIAPVGHDMRRSGQAVDQRRSGGLVGGLSGAERQADRKAVLVHNGVDLGAQSATRATDGVIRPPFFPPAACW